MLENQIKLALGELTFQLCAAQVRIAELENQLKEKDEPERTKSETLG